MSNSRDFYTLDDFDFTDKTTLVRVDFNSPLDHETKDITDDTRIRRHAKTIKELIEKNAKVVILAHQGRKGNPDYSTLEKHAEVLSTILNRKVGYVADVFGDKAQNAIRNLKPGEALVLENVRGFPGETAKIPPEEHAKSALVTTLAKLADVYVGDGFAVAHRSQASVVGFAGVLPCVAGRVMERELHALVKVRRAEEKPCLYVLGGAKAEDAAAVLLTDYGPSCTDVNDIKLVRKKEGVQSLSVQCDKPVKTVSSSLKGALKWEAKDGRIEIRVPTPDPVDVVILRW